MAKKEEKFDVDKEIERLSKNTRANIIKSEISYESRLNKLENEIDKALENMPSGLTVRNRRRYVNRALDEIAKSVGREYGILNPSSKGLKDVSVAIFQTFPEASVEASVVSAAGSVLAAVSAAPFDAPPQPATANIIQLITSANIFFFITIRSFHFRILTECFDNFIH